MLTKIGTLFMLCLTFCWADAFRFTDVHALNGDATTGIVNVRAKGELPPKVNFSDTRLWKLIATDGSSEKLINANGKPEWRRSSGSFAIQFDPAQLAGLDLKKVGWTVSFDNRFLTSSAPIEPKPKSFFSAAESKDSADLYVFGSYLAGVGTKPIYSIDAKLDWVPQIGESHYYVGIESSLVVNSGVDGPVDRTRVDPDSISGALSVQRYFRSFLLEVDPVKGEFSRKFPASDVVTTANLKWLAPPVPLKGAAFVFYPFGGYEVGSNLNKPAILFKEPVNLSRYNTITRGVIGVHTALLLFKKPVKAEAPYRLAVQLDYTGRALFEPEPIVTSGYVGGKRADITSVRSNMRHDVEGSIAYGVNDLIAIEVKYRYGSLPPLFEFVSHQVTVGITFKSTLPKTWRRRAAGP